MSGLIALIITVWLVLATAVAFHANEHDKSALLWFVIVLVTGLLGVLFYLLAIISGSSNEFTEGEPTDDLPDSDD